MESDNVDLLDFYGIGAGQEDMPTFYDGGDNNNGSGNSYGDAVQGNFNVNIYNDNQGHNEAGESETGTFDL